MDKSTEPAAAPPEAGKDASSDIDLTGSPLGDFRILRRLGQGGMGQVYLAEQVSLKRKVALKLLKPSLAANPTSLARFKKEAEAVARATHANIVQVYFIGENDGVHYMALEYVEGRNLGEHLSKKGTPDLMLGLSILRQVAAALQRASELGVIHRDIKPENILLTRKGEVKVTDFGLSRCLDGPATTSLTQSGVTMGTPLYMSPEQVEGRPVDHRTDIYSLGVTCYHMMTGHPPFEGETPFEVALKHVRDEAKPLREVRSDLPEMFCVMVHRMMAKDPVQRYQTGSELLQDVLRLGESLYGGTATKDTPAVDISGELSLQELGGQLGALSSVATRPALPRRSRPRVISLFALSVLVAAAGGAAYAWHLRRDVIAPMSTTPTPPVRNAEREQPLRQRAEEYLDPATAAANPAGAVACAGLGTFYLETDRLDDAKQFFQRLSELPKKPELDLYRTLGELGQAITLALQNKAEESRAVFQTLTTQPAFKTAVKIWLDDKQMSASHTDAPRLWQDAALRYWTVQALRFNEKNGVAEKDELLTKLRKSKPTP